jgi:hypothetical protein
MTFSEWRKSRLPVLRKQDFKVVPSVSVTAVIYHFWDDDETNSRFEDTEFSILQTWHCCGLLPARIITNRPCTAMLRFKQKHENVDVFISPRLIPGSIPSMSLDMNGYLSSYFETNYVLIIQNDGFPLQSGLDKYLHNYTYWGAPFSQARGVQPWIDKVFPCSVGNGGFSLRRRDLCVEANKLWDKWKWLIQDTRWMPEDGYYCLILRLLSWRYRRLISLPSRAEAFAFGYDKLAVIPVPEKLPFGVHGVTSFEALYDKFADEII